MIEFTCITISRKRRIQMKKLKKVLAVLLAALIAFSCLATPAFAASKVDPNDGAGGKLKSYFYMAVDKLVSFVVSILNRVIPGIEKNWPSIGDFKPSEDFYPGEEKFDAEVADGAKWSAGYSSASLIKDLEYTDGVYRYKGKKVYLAGSLEPLKGRQPTEIVDDQQVCTYALSDGTSGTVVHAVIDGYGIASGDVLKIRNRLAAFAKENNIIAINVSVLHQHSCIDTLGMAAPLVPALLTNPFLSVIGGDLKDYTGGKTTEFMENLYDTVAMTITEAVSGMEEGTLYYGSADISDYIFDKRDPQVYDSEMHRFRFDPDDESANEIWICEAGMHATGVGISGTRISADYPYYFRQSVKDATGADTVFVQGAELALTVDKDSLGYDGDDNIEKVSITGKKLADKTIAIDNDVALDPVLNIALQNVYVRDTNEILELAIREGLISSVIAKTKPGEYNVVTELGYMELGNKVGVVIVPGEIAPELLWGGVIESDKTWTGESWDYPSFAETAKVEKLICFGLANDQIGYILADNDFRSMFTENEEINAGSCEAGSTLTKAFGELVERVK